MGADAQCGERIAEPSPRTLAVDLDLSLGEERAAERGTFVADNDARAALACGQRRRETRWPGADDQHVAMIEGARVAIRIGLARGRSQPRGAADHRLIEASPGPVLAEQTRAHEGLVIEAGAEQRRGQVVDRADIELERRPAILARSDKAVGKLDLGCAQVWGYATRPAHNSDKRVRLFGAGAEDARAAGDI